MECHDNCPVSAKVDTLEREIERQRIEATEAHNGMLKRIGKLEQGRSAMDVKLDNIEEKLDRNTSTLNAIASKSGKRWDGIVDKITLLIVTAFVVYMLSKFGL